MKKPQPKKPKTKKAAKPQAAKTTPKTGPKAPHAAQKPGTWDKIVSLVKNATKMGRKPADEPAKKKRAPR